jgi:hypothetical protein
MNGAGAGRRPRPPAPLSLDGISTYPLGERKSKMGVGDFARAHAPGASFAAFLDSLPDVLAVKSLRALAADLFRARERGKPVLWGLGAHVLKVGLSPVLLDLMERGFVTGLALNGAGIVHDFELAVAGQTSGRWRRGWAAARSAWRPRRARR